jgi:hypothetical protein
MTRLHHPIEPDRPRLGVPVILRGGDEIQVGLEPPQALIFRGRALAELVAGLDGSRGRSEVLRSAPSVGLTQGEISRALRALGEAGLLEDAGAPAPTTPYQVRLVGSGVIGRQLAGLLLDSGEVRLFRYDDSVPVGPPGDRGPAIRSGRRTEAADRCTAVSHWTKPESVAIDLTILVGDGPECDRLVSDHLLRRDEAHLVVGSLGRGVRVGPLVLPGRTSCVHCTDLTRSDKDPQWPTLLPQLRRLRLDPHPVLATWAAAVATAQALAFLSGAVPEVAGATLELSAPDLAMRLRPWPAHPNCGCSWKSPTE